MKNRINKVRRLLQEKHLDSLVVLTDFNRRYLSGFTGTSGGLLITQDQARLITDFRYIDQATEQAPFFEIVKQESDLYSSVITQIQELNLQNIGFEGHLVSYDAFLKLNQGRHDLISIGDEIEKIRRVKDADEIKLIQKAADIVDQAYEHILTVAKPGMTGKEIDSIARQVITDAGYGDNFGHSLGHGIGLDVHEQPALSQKSDTVLEINHCVTIEPGIYVNGLGGVRIEDDILITENGGQCFTNCRKDLIIL
ncbi:M24 family metallopeptidase [Staphylococcus coagulans]|uniref:M24 family metallopeptidase n=1 Tax=Staphylococcus coagulans TaxID=74706 RepID=UPI003364D5FC